ncbi:MAG: hypothetical protein HYW78_00440 [Parcubacteria group bacterium]|nr:hypothetical protein [Parcubacteria group bacterium]
MLSKHISDEQRRRWAGIGSPEGKRVFKPISSSLLVDVLIEHTLLVVP